MYFRHFVTRLRWLTYIIGCVGGVSIINMAVMNILLSINQRDLVCLPIPNQRHSSHYQNYHNHTYPTIYSVSKISYILNNNFCNKKFVIFLIVCITSKSDNFEARSAIRKTWASDTFDGRVHFVFFVGKNMRKNVNNLIEEEHKKYGDLVLVNFEDSYRNLTFKSISMLKWVSEYCFNSKFMLKIDDDIFIHLPVLLSLLQSLKYTKVILGHVLTGSTPSRTSKKWALLYEDYVHDEFLPYVSGPSYVISSDLMPDLLKAVSTSHVLDLEDVYITGICGSKVRATLIGNCGFRNDSPHLLHWLHNNFLSGHKYSPAELLDIWNLKHSFFNVRYNWMSYILQLSI